ncbi:hypothetical protein [Clostridium peptidivorans]|uniref:hypothetical protein n=1 Tax=Clostridium peptidivorans TaxID=100174 RepID=UPI000BE41F93|nr:hypothetical protein [Clostridium peptidivorans]
MSALKRIIGWMMISLIIQFAGLYYIDNVYLANNTPVRVKKIEDKSNNKKKDVEVAIPENAQNINVSFDGKYLAYYDEDILKVVSNKTGEKKDVCFEEGVKISYYKWLSDRNRMLIAEKHSTQNGMALRLSYYDIGKDTKEEIKDLTWADTESEVESIEASTLTNVIHIKVSRGNGKSSIYWINIMKDMKKLYTNDNFIGEIRTLNHQDKLLYEGKTYNSIYSTNKNNSIKIDGVKVPKLLGVDEEDNVYIGSEENEKITKVYYGSIEKPTSEWKVIELNEPIDKNDIYISKKGQIFLNDNLKGIIKEASTGKQTAYKGTFLQIYDDGVASISEGKLQKAELK